MGPFLIKIAIGAALVALVLIGRPFYAEALEPGKAYTIVAFCVGEEGLRALVDMQTRWAVPEDAGDEEGAGRIYLEFMLDPSIPCLDSRLGGPPAFLAPILGRAGVPPIPRTNCQETIHWEVFTDDADTMYTWSTERGDSCDA